MTDHKPRVSAKAGQKQLVFSAWIGITDFAFLEQYTASMPLEMGSDRFISRAPPSIYHRVTSLEKSVM